MTFSILISHRMQEILKEKNYIKKIEQYFVLYVIFNTVLNNIIIVIRYSFLFNFQFLDTTYMSSQPGTKLAEEGAGLIV